MKNFLYAVLRTYFLIFFSLLICTWKLNFKFSTINRKNFFFHTLIALKIKRNLQTCGTEKWKMEYKKNGVFLKIKFGNDKLKFLLCFVTENSK